MIGLDTNVLLRYLVRDDPDQTRRATHVIETKCTPDAPGFVNLIVLAEFVWTLENGYRYRRTHVAGLVERLVSLSDIRVEAADVVSSLLPDDSAGGPGLADYLILEINRRAGCSSTVTFDRKMTALSDGEAL